MSVDAVVAELVAPHAARFDEEQRLPESLLAGLEQAGLFGVHEAHALGTLHRAIGRHCAATRALLTVHGMVSASIARWGTALQQARWQKPLASGATIAAFALSETDAGSDVQAMQTRAEKDGDGYRLFGEKCWISFGQRADLFLVFAKLEGQVTAFLLPKETAGLHIEPISGMLGARASMLARLRFDGAKVSEVLGAPGFGFSFVALSALDLGRFTVAFGALGLAEACLDASLAHARSRSAFGKTLGEQPAVQALLTEMIMQVELAAALCQAAAETRAAGGDAIDRTIAAKYAAAKAAMLCASHAVQIHGAQGLAPGALVGRHFRDAKVMEIIEGSNEVLIAHIAQARLRRSPTP